MAEKVKVMLKDLKVGDKYESKSGTKIVCLRHEKDGVRVKTPNKEMVLPYESEGDPSYDIFSYAVAAKAEKAKPKKEKTEEKEAKPKMKFAKGSAIKFIDDKETLKAAGFDVNLAGKQGTIADIVEVPDFGGYKIDISINGKILSTTSFKTKRCIKKFRKTKPVEIKVVSALKKGITQASKTLKVAMKDGKETEIPNFCKSYVTNIKDAVAKAEEQLKK